MLIKVCMQRFDILHIHWLERAFWATSSRAALRQAAYAVALALLLKARGTRLVWTAHDPEPHASPLNRHLLEGWTRHVWPYYRIIIISLIDGVLLLSSSHRNKLLERYFCLGAVPMEVVPHPHYKGQYLDEVDRGAARLLFDINDNVTVIAFIGSLREYKNPQGLIEAFKDLEGDLVLLLAGLAETPEQAERLTQLADADPRIKLSTAFVPDDALQYLFRAADLSVLPYKRVTNSGSAYLSLSFDLPVLVPDEPVFHEIEAIVGPTWVKRYSGDLTAENLRDAVAWAGEPRPRRPDLSTLSIESTAAQTLAFFERLVLARTPS